MDDTSIIRCNECGRVLYRMVDMPAKAIKAIKAIMQPTAITIECHACGCVSKHTF